MRKIIILLMTCFLLISQKSFGQRVTLEKIIVDSNNKNLTIDITVDFFGIKKLVKLLTKQGVPLVFEGNVKIEKKRKLLWDKTIIEREVKFVVSYDPIANEFHLKNHKKIHGKSIDDLLNKLKIIKVNIPIWQGANSNQDYNLIVTYSIKKMVPYWIEKTLFFWNFEITPTMQESLTFSF